MRKTKANRRKKIHYRIRNKIKGTATRPRLNIFRSNRFIYAQVIDDVNGLTLASASSFEAAVVNEGNKSEQAKKVGALLADRCKEQNITSLVFDRGGYLYHGRVKALADGAREGGLQF